jgi:hypothetical protein
MRTEKKREILPHEERIEMKLAAADLLVIRTYKLGWPGFPTPSKPGD